MSANRVVLVIFDGDVDVVYADRPEGIDLTIVNLDKLAELGKDASAYEQEIAAMDDMPADIERYATARLGL